MADGRRPGGRRLGSSLKLWSVVLGGAVGVAAGAPPPHGDRRAELRRDPDAESAGWIEGVVTKAEGVPVRSARVSVTEDRTGHAFRQVDAVTDARGRFAVRRLLPGVYALVVVHSELAPVLLRELAISPGGGAHFTQRLSLGETIRGRVRGPDGNPVSAVVRLDSIDGFTLPRTLAPTTTTDEAGSFSLRHAPAGRVRLAVSRDGWRTSKLMTSVEPGKGPVLVKDITLERGRTLSGYVRREDGRGLAGALVRAFARGTELAAGSRGGVSKSDGSFEITSLLEAPDRVVVAATGYGTIVRQVDAQAVSVEVVLQPAGAIVGKVVEVDGKPIRRCSILLEGEDGNLVRDAGVEDDSGRFAVADLAAGRYALRLSAPGYAVLTVSELLVSAGRTLEIGAIRLTRGGRIEGNVVDESDSGVEGATVRTLRSAATTVRSDEAGRFEIDGVNPGPVHLAVQHPEFAAAIAAVDADPIGPTEVTITLTRGGRVAGTARRRDRSPMLGLELRLAAGDASVSNDWVGEEAVLTGEGGSFAFERIVPGRRLLSGHASGGGTGGGDVIVAQYVNVEEGRTSYVDVVLREVRVQGILLRRGTPIEGVRVAFIPHAIGALALPSSMQGWPGAAVTDGEGRYELRVPQPGPCTVLLERIRDGMRFQPKELNLADADTVVLDLELGSGTVLGTATNAATEEPLLDVTVSAVNAASGVAVGQVKTGPQGEFRLEVDPGDYVLTAWAERFAPVSQSVRVEPAEPSEVRLELFPALALSGKVQDAGGRPLAGVSATALSSATPEGPQALRDVTVTRLDGAFAFSHVVEGPYNIFVGSGQHGFAVASAVPTGTTDVVLTPRPGGRVRLRVFGPRSEPVRGAYALVAAVGSVPVSSPAVVAADESGMVELDAPAGPVLLSVASDEGLGARITVFVPENGLLSRDVRLGGATGSGR